MAPTPRLSQGCIQPAQPSSGLNLSASTSVTMWGKNTGHHTGRLSIEQDIAAGVLTVDAQQGVKKKPSDPQHGGGSANASRGVGLAEVRKCRIEGACTPADTTVPPKKLCCFRPVASPQVCPAVTRIRSLSSCVDFAAIPHTQGVCSCPLVWQQPEPGAGLHLC